MRSVGAAQSAINRIRDKLWFFDQEELFGRKAAYRRLFNSPDGVMVLTHLAQTCYAFDSPAPPGADADQVMRNVGALEVYQMIMSNLGVEVHQAVKDRYFQLLNERNAINAQE